MRLEENDHLRLRLAIAEEVIADRALTDARTAREQVQRDISQKYGLREQDSLDVPTGTITKAPIASPEKPTESAG